MAHAYRLDCDAAAVDCRFIVQSENEDEAVELAKQHIREVHGTAYTEEELRSDHLAIV